MSRITKFIERVNLREVSEGRGRLSGAERAVLARLELLTDYHGPHKGTCCVAYTTLASQLGYAAVTVQKAIYRLNRRGVIAILAQGVNGRTSANRYRILWNIDRGEDYREFAEKRKRAEQRKRAEWAMNKARRVGETAHKALQAIYTAIADPSARTIHELIYGLQLAAQGGVQKDCFRVIQNSRWNPNQSYLARLGAAKTGKAYAQIAQSGCFTTRE